MKISKGLATWAGLVGAVGGFLLALATFMDTFDELDPLAGLGPLAAAAAVLWKVIDGRMKQATAQIEAGAKPAQLAPATYAIGSTGTGTYVTSTFTQPRPGAELRTPDLGAPQRPDLEIPGGSVPTNPESPE